MGNQQRNIYDRLGRLLKTQSFENNNWVTLSENHYNMYSLVDWTKDVAGNQTFYQYEVLGRVEKITNPDLKFKRIIYNDAWIYEGNTSLVQTIDEENRSTWTYYDKNGLNTSTRVIDTSYYKYDDVGNLIQFTDNKGNVTTYAYDDLNRLIQVNNALLEKTSYSYDNLNRLTLTTYPKGTTKQLRYDDAGRVIEKTDESGNKEKFYYDRVGNLDAMVDLNGQSLDYVYDGRNQLTSVISTSNGTTQTKSFSYNDAGQRLSATNESGTWKYQYRTDNGTLTRVTYPDGKYVEIDDQKTLSQASMTDPFGQKIYYKNNKLGQLQYVSLNSTFSTLEANYTYTANGKIDTIVYPNGTIQDYDYYSNDGNQLQKVRHLNSAGTVLNEYSYDYDPNFNIKTIVEGTTSTSSASFDYDKLNRIQSQTSTASGAESYTYDTQGNRLTMQSDNPINMEGEIQYQYDKWNQLTSVTTNGTNASYKYDPDGLLYERVSNGTKNRYYYFNSELIAEGNVNTDGNAVLKARYIRGVGLVARMDGSGNKAYYLTNGHGDVMEMRNSSGGVVNKYKYTIWGSVTHVVPETVPNPFKYSGEFWDDTTGLQYLRARWYDPSMGRFINKDTYEGDMTNPLSLNLYTYVSNNPLRFADPSGHMAVPKLNEFLAQYINGDITTDEMINGVIYENGDGAIYTAFHEITQILAADRIYAAAGAQGEIPILEYKVEKGEVDIFYNNQYWEVKAKYSKNFIIMKDAAWEDLEKQMKKYEKYLPEGTERGSAFNTIDGIHIVGNLYMTIEYLASGKILYSMYSVDKQGVKDYFTKTNAGPANYVDVLFFSDPFNITISTGGKKPGKKK